MSNYQTKGSSGSKGITLIELMISQTLGLVVISALSGVLITAIANFQNSTAVSLLQESTRIAVETLNHTIQQAGYRGCTSKVTYTSAIDLSHASISANIRNWAYHSFGLRGISADDVDLINQVFGDNWNKQRYPAKDQAIGDILLTRSATGPEMELAGHDPDNQTMDFKGNLTDTLSNGQILEVNDCNHDATFQIDRIGNPVYFSNLDITRVRYDSDQTINCAGLQSNTNGQTSITGRVLLGGTSDASCTDEESRSAYQRYQFAPGTMAHRVNTIAHYLAIDGSSGEPTLYQVKFSENGTRSYSEAMVEGIENIRFQFGFDDDHDGSPNHYLNATTLNSNPDSWQRVVSVKVWMTVRSIPGRGHSEFNASIVFPDTQGNLVQCGKGLQNQIQACPGIYPDAKKPRKRAVIEKEFYLRNHIIEMPLT